MNKLERLNMAVQLLKENKIITSQADIAKELGYNRVQSISDILNGKVSVTTKFVKGFCGSYNVREEYIETGKGEVFIKHGELHDADIPYETGSGVTRVFRGFNEIINVITTPIDKLRNKSKAVM
ncbi:MAG: hypothetical protein ACTHKV_14900 [Flavipsychrobacter sp.]